MPYDIPVLIIAFNRPNVSKRTFEVIRQLKPMYLYIAIDGARDQVPGEKELVKQVMTVYHEIDWPCYSFYRQNPNNLGAEYTVSGAVSWVLSEHEYCVVLEDDILANPAFFDFAKQMLLKYKDNQSVYQVSAAQFTPMESMKTDYVFSIYGHTGFGWATWRRAWQRFSMGLNDLDETLSNAALREQFSCTKAYKSFLSHVKRMKKEGIINNSWDRCWSYIRIRDNGLSIVPRCNLTQNIGIWGLHASGTVGYHNFVADEDFTVKIHPEEVAVDFLYDQYHFTHYLHHGVFSKAVSKAKHFVRSLLPLLDSDQTKES